jgi:DNA-binding response OmpR family regulator
MAKSHKPDLQGCKVLVMEDEYLLAEEARMALADCGADIVGPVPDVSRGLELAQNEDLRCAVLDINLRGEQVFPVASELAKRGIPYLYVSGYEPSSAPDGLQPAAHVRKPVDYDELARLVGNVCGR